MKPLPKWLQDVVSSTVSQNIVIAVLSIILAAGMVFLLRTLLE